MTDENLDIVGLTEVANLMGVSKGYVSVLRIRGKMPEPDAELACGPIWWRTTVNEWLAFRTRGGK